MVTYGTHGQSNRYIYVVSDNVRTKQKIYPTVKHYKNGALFPTTAVVENTYKTTGATGKLIGNEDEYTKTLTSPEIKGLVDKTDKDFSNVVRRDNLLNSIDNNPKNPISNGKATQKALGTVTKKEQFQTYDEYAKQFEEQTNDMGGE